MKNPYDHELTKLEQYQLFDEADNAKAWAKSWRILFFAAFGFMLAMAAVSMYRRESRDAELEAANARVLAMADLLAKKAK